MVEVTLSSVDRVFQYLDPLDRMWMPSGVPNPITGSGWIFRGQRKFSWPLQPSAFRPGTLGEFRHQPDAGPRLNVYSHAKTEVKVLREFILSADSVGIRTPLSVAVLHRLSELISDIERARVAENPHDFDMFSGSLPEAFALAQHHCIPTRLLDWSHSMYHALFFAAWRAFENETTPDNEEFMAVWALNYPRLEYDFFGKSNVQILLSPFSSDPFLQSQKGLFTYVRDSNAAGHLHGRWLAQDEIVRAHSERISELSFVRAKIPTRFAKDILRRLFHMRINLVELMPTLDNAAANLRLYRRVFYE